MSMGQVVFAQSFTSQGYKASSPITTGSLVSLDSTDYHLAQVSTQANRDSLLGVAVSSEQALVSLSDKGSTVQVVTSGQASVLVSTANGNISVGDYLSISPISGVAMKAMTAGKVIGVAQQDYNDHSASKKNVELTTNDGKKTTVQVGTIAVKVLAQDWTPSDQPNSPLLNSLRSFLGSAVGKPVSNTQAIFSVAIILLAVLASATILYSSISSSIHSIGRNPLSKGIIRRSLVVMFGLSIIVIVGAGMAVYLILGG